MTDVTLVYRSQRPGCGINIFSQRLGATLNQFGFNVNQCNLANTRFTPGGTTIIHYAPSMWARDDGALERVLQHVKPRRTVAILHGIYKPGTEVHMKESRCPELPSHLGALGCCAETVIALSQSCEKVWRQWDTGHFAAKLKVVPHPGAQRLISNITTVEPYLFIGGINRPKKDITGEKLAHLLSAYLSGGIKVWVHICNASEDAVWLPVWRLTTGILSDEEWVTAMGHATAVLCPYETKIQCVSGVISEALSLGTSVISTDFLFAREMRRKHPKFVYIDDNLLHWVAVAKTLLRRRGTVCTSHSYFPTWAEFGARIARELCARL